MRLRIAGLARIGGWIGKPRGWERLVRLAAPPESCGQLGELVVEREGFVLRIQPTTPLGWNVLLFGTYEPELRAVFRGAMPAGGVAVDAGANIGWHTLLLARLAGPEGRVFAAEPNPSVRERLAGNIAANRLENVSILPLALAEAPSRVAFLGPSATDGASGSGHLVPGSAAESGTFEVETRSLDSVVAESGIARLDLLKIDVEGFELAVLRGAEESIARFRPQIVFEFNAEYAPRGSATVQQFEELFARLRYRLSSVGRGGAKPLASGIWPPNTDIWAEPL